MNNEDIQMLAEAIRGIGEAISDANDITMADGSRGSVAIGISQALFQIAENTENFAFHFARYVDLMHEVHNK